MSWTSVKPTYDEETRILLDISVHFLAEYFGHSSAEADELLGRFLEKWHPKPFDDDSFHHDGPYRVAAAVEFFEVERGQHAEFVAWLRAKGHFEVPWEAAEYTNKHYWGAWDK